MQNLREFEYSSIVFVREMKKKQHMLGRVEKTIRRSFWTVCPGDVVEKRVLLLWITLGISIEYEHKTSKGETLKFSLFVCSRKFSQSYAITLDLFAKILWNFVQKNIPEKRKRQEFEVLQLHRATDPSNDLRGIYKIVSSLFDQRAWICGQRKDLPRFRDRSVL